MSLTVTEQTLVGRITGGHVAALTPAQVLTLLGVGPIEIDGHANASPTAAQLASVNMATIHNYQQAASNVNVTLPAPVASLSAMVQIATAQAANYFRVTCTGKIFHDGSMTPHDFVQFAAPNVVVGNYFSLMTLKIADGSYAYFVSSGIGALVAG